MSRIFRKLRYRFPRNVGKPITLLLGFTMCIMGWSAVAQEAAPPDTSSPVLTSMTLSPNSITLGASDPSTVVSLTLTFTDENPITSEPFYLQSLHSDEQIAFFQIGNWQTRGTVHTGQFTANLSSTSDTGLWHVANLQVSDSLNNVSTQYDTLEKLMLARVSPFISISSSDAQAPFDSLIAAMPAFSQSLSSQSSFLNITLQDAVEYDIWFVPNANTSIRNITFSDFISLAQVCTPFDTYTKCTLTSSNNNQAIFAQIDTLSGDVNTFGYSAFVQPNAQGSESQWLTNYVEFPRVDFDNDGMPNEQDLDDDNDTVPDTLDLFPLNASESKDFDGDGIGDNADIDDDNDNVPDTQDAFPYDVTENNDNDGDGIGDNRDNDDDNDLVLDTQDAFPFDPSESLDSDGDGIGNNADPDDDNDGGTDDNDAFPLDPTETIDSDGDGIGNNADPDDDNDGVPDVNDAFTRDPNESVDTDQDGIGNNADLDDDNDGVDDIDDLFPLDPGDFRDNDLDGIGDNADDDDDNDNVIDSEDAFPFNAFETRDSDGDGIGNNADPDDDNDGLDDVFDVFPFDPSEVSDFDGDRIGDNADNDDDNDGVLDAVDAFPFAVTEWLDTDNDGIGNNADLDNDNDGVDDEFDAFDNDPTETVDTDGDTIGNNADLDDDNDDVPDTQDAFPLDANESIDTDRDGIGNNEDTDDDGDRIADDVDLFPLDPLESIDNDLDGIGNNGDLDDDNDGVLDIDDAFPFDPTESVDFDSDGIGDNADTDDDNDGFDDNIDLFPLNPSEWADNDLDGQGDNRDNDDDNDGILDIEDAFSFDPNETIDTDLDGIGNNADDDDDNDGVLDDVDAFPLASAEWLDTDLDGMGNNADQDDDNDGIVDVDDIAPLNPRVGDEQAPILDQLSDIVIEATAALTPLELVAPRMRDDNLNPATLTNDFVGALEVGIHTVTWTAIDFAANVSTLEQTITVQDTTAPVFTNIDAINIPARGIFTDISQNINISAFDLVDGAVAASIITNHKLRAGEHQVTLEAVDVNGNVAIKEIVANVLPILSFPTQGLSEPGNTFDIDVVLSDEAPAYPVSVAYTITGPVRSAVTGVLEINQGQNGTLSVTAAPTASIGEQIWITFSDPQNATLSDISQVRIELSNTNVAPVSHIKLMQNNMVTSVAYQDQDSATLLANINDINRDDQHQVTWQIRAFDNTLIDNSLINLSATELSEDGSHFVFDPAKLSIGVFRATAVVVERNTTELYSTNIDFVFSVKPSKPILEALVDSDLDGLSDELEGLVDSDLDGIADYLDNQSNTANLPTGASDQPIVTLPGYRLTIGDIVSLAKGQSAANASVSSQEISEYGLFEQEGNQLSSVNTQDIHFNALQSIINFNIENLREVGESVAVVVPLNTNTFIVDDVVYRKFNAEQGWFTFVENAHNGIYSASFDEDGNCPQPDSSLYINGLNIGDTCIKLIIQDGGPNDGDLTANGIIKDPGVLSSRLPNRSPLITVARENNVIEGDNVRVDASMTSDVENDELRFTWTQIGGLRIGLDESNSPLLSFSAPLVDRTESLLFRLDVYDGRDVSTASVRINILNRNTPALVSIQAPSNTVGEGQQITLNASVFDEDGDLLSYEWRQTSGPAVTFSAQSISSVVVTMPQVDESQNVTIAIFVTDGEKQVSADTTILVNNVTTASAPSPDAGSGGGALNIYVIILGFVIALGRRKVAL